MKSLLKIVCISGCVLMLASCKKETYELDKFSMSNFNGEYAAPLVASDLTVRDILSKVDKDSNIVVDNNGFCTLIFRGTLFTSRAKDFVFISNQNLGNLNYNFSNTTTLITFNAASNGTTFGPYSQTLTATFTPTPPLIDSLYTNSGTSLDLNINNSMPANVTLTLTSASIIDLSTMSTFNKVITLSASSSTLVSYDLGNHLLKLGNGSTRSVISLTYNASMQKTSNASGVEQISISSSINNISFNKFIGYLGANYTHPNFAPYKDTVPITLFKSSDPTYTNTIFSLVDPQFEVRFYNEIGVSAKLDFTRLDAYTPDAFGNNLNPNSLSGSPVIQNIIINSAVDFSTPKTSSLSINKTVEPQVVPFLNSRPKNVIYEVNGAINPGSSPYIRNFFTDTSRIRVDLDVILPLWGNMKDLVFLDTVKIDLSNINPYTKQIILRTYFESTFPVDLGTTIVFTDTLYNTLYTLIPANTVVIPGANVDSNGNTSAPKIYKKDYVIPQSAMSLLKQSKRILIKAFANTSNYPTNVKIYDFQKLKIRMGIDVKPYFSGN
ncbi:MAG TPA: hypothetical protein PK995_07770 [Bacteroidia bacterium]|nr:hypothetical protein [Bacteroidia bacterium]